ncbi:MAG: hypothetical protein ACW97X_12845 [Candidatus Hodarchaeales archaeon]
MISGVYIFRTSGLPIFYSSLDQEHKSMNQVLFGGISSAINMLIKEIARSELQSINVEDGTLHYSVKNDLIFVIHSKGPKIRELAKFLIKQVMAAFIEDFGIMILDSAHSIVDNSLFQPFERKALEIYKTFMKLYESQPNLFEFIPNDIPLALIQDLLKEGENLVEGFPDDTIRLVRRLDDKYEARVNREVLFSLGVFFGIELSKKYFPDTVNINQGEVLKLLNEISIAKFNKKTRAYVLSICPVCRGKTSSDAMCNFFTGFIEGCFDNPNLFVQEATCKAKGDKNCSFILKYSREKLS